MIEMKLHGWAAVDEALAKLSKELQVSIANKATKQGALVIRDAARNNVGNMDTGLLKTQIDVGKGKNKGSMAKNIMTTGKNFIWLVGLKKWSSFKGGIPAFYGKFIELGTVSHKIVAGIKGKGKKAKKTGKTMLYSHKSGKFYGKEVEIKGIKARPFLRPALDNNTQKALQVTKNFLWAGIANAIMGSPIKGKKNG